MSTIEVLLLLARAQFANFCKKQKKIFLQLLCGGWFSLSPCGMHEALQMWHESRLQSLMALPLVSPQLPGLRQNPHWWPTLLLQSE